MFIRNLLIVSLLFAQLSCSGQKNDNLELIGAYKSKNKTNYFNYFILRERYMSTMTLEIESDSTFVKKSCSSISTGNWSVRNDSLILHVKEVELILGEKSDENYELKYLIKNGDLIRKTNEKGNKKVKLIYYLVKD